MSKFDQSRTVNHKILKVHFITNRAEPKLGEHIGGTIVQLSVTGNSFLSSSFTGNQFDMYSFVSQS